MAAWIISNGHISATAHSIHLYSAHRAVIFAIAQLSCYNNGDDYDDDTDVDVDDCV